MYESSMVYSTLIYKADEMRTELRTNYRAARLEAGVRRDGGGPREAVGRT